jgi:hypothetical protein
MKKIIKIKAITIAVLFAMFFVTCDAFLPGGDDETGYTDVEYSDDGSQVTVWINGSKPVPPQRAMTRDLARMAYDYFEVIFISGTGATNIARASWELGQSAGISGVDRGATAAGIDYEWATGKTTTATTGIALMFVGRKDGRTLLGVGRIGDVDHAWSDGTGSTTHDTLVSGVGFPNNNMTAKVTSESSSVTFFIEPVRTGLLIGVEKANTLPGLTGTPVTSLVTGGNDYNILTDSFDFVTTGSSVTVPAWVRTGHSSRSTLGGLEYPMYSLPQAKDTTPLVTQPVQVAKYDFAGAADRFKAEIKYNAAVTATPQGGIFVEKRFPRFMDGGRYGTIKSGIDTDTTVEHTLTAAVDSAFVPSIPLKFVTKGSGVFSFFIEIPVYMITKDPSTNGSLKAEVWRIRTGIGSELYSLDTGKSAGGSVLMGIGVSSLDELEIEWAWIQ